MLKQMIIEKAVALLSGPGGLASFLRRRHLGAQLGGPCDAHIWRSSRSAPTSAPVS